MDSELERPEQNIFTAIGNILVKVLKGKTPKQVN